MLPDDMDYGPVEPLGCTLGCVVGLIIVGLVLTFACGCTTCKPECCASCAPQLVTLPCPPTVTVAPLPPPVAVPPEPAITSAAEGLTCAQWVQAVLTDLARWMQAFREARGELEAVNAARPTPTPTPGGNP